MGKTYYKVVVCIFIMHLCTFTLNAQVGIGTTTPAASAQLDITSTDRGFLMPRVALTSTTDTATINGAEVTSLLVYNTATVSDVTPGFYYWDGAQWVTLGGTTPAAWELTGNTGTNPNTNFLGTIDGQDLVIRTNNVETLRVTQPDGSNDIQLIAGYNGNRGTINNPLYAFSNDLDTGIWSDGGDEFSLGAGGREFITIDEAAQDVLILNDRSQDIDLRIESDDQAQMFSIDGNNNQVIVREDVGVLAGIHFQSNTDDADTALGATTSSTGSAGFFGADIGSTGQAVFASTITGADAIYTQSTSTGLGLYFLTNVGNPGVLSDLTLVGETNDAIIGFADNNDGFGAVWGLNVDGYGLLGMNSRASDYSGGVFGNVQSSGGSGRRSSGVFGSNVAGTSQNASGSLGYRPSAGGTYYGGYFFDNNGGVDHTDGAGFTSGSGHTGSGNGFRTAQTTDDIKVNVGFGAIGGLMGGWAKGAVYGFTAQGTRYSLYVDGREFTNDVITQLNDNDGADRIPTYVPTSTTVDVSSKGMSNLVNGQRRITFDRNFSTMISSKEPVIVTVTPIGESNGVHLVASDAHGFIVKENANGSSNVQFTWIAIATKKGYETVENPEELMTADYDKKLDNFMIDESIENPVGQEMWWDGSQIRYSGTPATAAEYGYSTAKEKKQTPDQIRRREKGIQEMPKKTYKKIPHEKDDE
ncbi:MAG: hypothetical protein HRT68_03800 [Flavobacteriaceae bacterium]|nr:hypothetical protein [Flavobacteriaceae bacterium]